jgi:hypothetical protein
MLSFPSSGITSSSSRVFFLNKLENGNGSSTVSLRKIAPAMQAASNNKEQMAQGRK